eukprot:CAMPEP_0183736074 /NCGR_PEP_ID=MMETSP0737-20130205/48442_1 /TAXON_ID=385413 /ORGANISM="Thalassiosira miniscula, Strain CCMP1093" /LENGTH=493 /DNA_ID=CAMNT_0025969989 /DNA_START=61 /DNA_END=1542 /DNA_ORIENTATION=-
MNFLHWTLISIVLRYGNAFTAPPFSVKSTLPTSAAAQNKNPSSRRRHSSSSTSSCLYGIQEWRDEALSSKYTLDSYAPPPSSSSVPATSAIPATVPILPFPFSDILLQGQRTQLNLYEQRFHELFQDAMDNHCGMVGMGLLAGQGMITTLPLCEVESFSRFGSEENWIGEGNEMGAMGNGSIFVTIRAVGRCKISEDELIQEDPYMKARVVEIFDEDVSLQEGAVKEKSSGAVKGESSPVEVASTVAGTIENLMVSLSSMEHKLKEIEDGELKKKKQQEKQQKQQEKSDGGNGMEEKDDGEDEVMNRRLLNAQLESLFMKDSSEGVDLDSSEGKTIINEDDKYDDEEEEDEDEEDDLLDDPTNDDNLDRLAQFQKAFQHAKETDTFGYVVQPTTAIDDLSQTEYIKQQTSSTATNIRTPKDLTAISWAAFCTGDKNNIQRDVMKIQALDMSNVMQRLQLASAMLREEKKKLAAKLALAGIKEIMEEGKDGEES